MDKIVEAAVGYGSDLIVATDALHDYGYN